MPLNSSPQRRGATKMAKYPRPLPGKVRRKRKPMNSDNVVTTAATATCTASVIGNTGNLGSGRYRR